MARVDDDPVFGKLSGAVGTVVVVRWGNKTYLRSRPYWGKIKSATTKRQNGGFKAMVQYLRPFKDFFNTSMQLGSSARGWNRALSLNLKYALETSNGITTVRPERVCIANGPLPGVDGLQLQQDGRSITLTWDTKSMFTGYDPALLEAAGGTAFSRGGFNDRITVLMVAENRVIAVFYASRTEGVCQLEVPTYRNYRSCDIYLFATSADNRLVSFSQYVGRVEV